MLAVLGDKFKIQTLGPVSEDADFIAEVARMRMMMMMVVMMVVVMVMMVMMMVVMMMVVMDVLTFQILSYWHIILYNNSIR